MFASVIFLICFFLGIPSAEKQKVMENQYVKVNVALPDSVEAGGRGRILLAFSPADGIHVTVDPTMEVSLKKNRVFTIQGDPEVSIDKESGFLSSSHPVEQRFSISPSTKPGMYSMKGTIVYYFCSDAEGWCRKFVQPISLTLHVVGKR